MRLNCTTRSLYCLRQGNRKTAKGLELTIPQTLIASADVLIDESASSCPLLALSGHDVMSDLSPLLG